MASVAPLPRVEGEPAPAPLAPIIVKKVTVVSGGHHGGAWKVAYADFVTAMMAFFLLLWLLGATTEDQRKGLADYFTPTLVYTREESAGSAEGLLGGSSLTDVDNYPHEAGQTGTQSITIPRGAEGGPVEGGTEDGERRRAEIARRIEQQLQAVERLRHLSRQVRVLRTPEGVRIDLVDDADFSMFHLSSTVLVPEAQELLGIISATLAQESGQLIVRGHTDALPWREGVRANNWSLSTGRAEATRQEMLRHGISESRFDRIEGVADRELLVRDDPGDPRNRRISILLVE